jgi:hypothetical protein
MHSNEPVTRKAKTEPAGTSVKGTPNVLVFIALCGKLFSMDKALTFFYIENFYTFNNYSNYPNYPLRIFEL